MALSMPSARSACIAGCDRALTRGAGAAGVLTGETGCGAIGLPLSSSSSLSSPAEQLVWLEMDLMCDGGHHKQIMYHAMLHAHVSSQGLESPLEFTQAEQA